MQKSSNTLGQEIASPEPLPKSICQWRSAVAVFSGNAFEPLCVTYFAVFPACDFSVFSSSAPRTPQDGPNCSCVLHLSACKGLNAIARAHARTEEEQLAKHSYSLAQTRIPKTPQEVQKHPKSTPCRPNCSGVLHFSAPGALFLLCLAEIFEDARAGNCLPEPLPKSICQWCSAVAVFLEMRLSLCA